MKRIPVCSLMLAALVIGCSGVPRYASMQTSEGPFSVRVLPQGPPTWTYTLDTIGSSGIVAVTIVSSHDLSDVKLSAATKNLEWSRSERDQGLQVLLKHREYRRLVLTLSGPDHQKGVVFIRVKDDAGIERVLGPVPGPGEID